VTPLTAIPLTAGLRSSRIRRACMGIGLLAQVPELARIHRCKKNYAAGPGRCRLDAHSSSGNLWSVCLSRACGVAGQRDDIGFDSGRQGGGVTQLRHMLAGKVRPESA
jgi:hypothetical protein